MILQSFMNIVNIQGTFSIARAAWLSMSGCVFSRLCQCSLPSDAFCQHRSDMQWSGSSLAHWPGPQGHPVDHLASSLNVVQTAEARRSLVPKQPQWLGLERKLRSVENTSLFFFVLFSCLIVNSIYLSTVSLYFRFENVSLWFRVMYCVLRIF